MYMCFKMSLVPIPIGVQGYKSKDKAAEMQVVFLKIQPNFCQTYRYGTLPTYF